MKRFLFCLAALFFACSGCSDRSPIGPSVISPGPETQSPAPEPAPQLLTIQGRVYARTPLGEPLLAGATVTVSGPDDSEEKATTDVDGFYELSVRPGTITITASKEGYEPKTWDLTLSTDTVLNFGLVPKPSAG